MLFLMASVDLFSEKIYQIIVDDLFCALSLLSTADYIFFCLKKRNTLNNSNKSMSLLHLAITVYLSCVSC